jgi:hypothetical protein
MNLCNLIFLSRGLGHPGNEELLLITPFGVTLISVKG